MMKLLIITLNLPISEGGTNSSHIQGDFLVLEGESLRSIRPYFIWELRILSILMKASAQGVVGGVL